MGELVHFPPYDQHAELSALEMARIDLGNALSHLAHALADNPHDHRQFTAFNYAHSALEALTPKETE